MSINNNLINSENTNSTTTSSLNTLQTLTRYPFNGRTKTLIDDFYIIGYSYRTLEKEFIKGNRKFLLNYENFTGKEKQRITFSFKEPPSLLNKMSNDFSKEILDIDIIIDMIFPKKIKFYFTIENLSNNDILTRKSLKIKEKIKPKQKFSDKTVSCKLNKTSIVCFSEKNLNSIYDNNKNKDDFLPKSYNVIFSSNPQSGTNSKKSINGFAHVFYKKFDKPKIIKNNKFYFYAPVVFCIISEYPFYNSYFKLIKQIKQLFLQTEIKVPIEIIIQNILNFTISPINGNVYLNIEPKNFFIPNENYPIKNNDSFDSIKEEDEYKNNDYQFSNKMKSSEINSILISDLKNFASKSKKKSRVKLKRAKSNENINVDKIFQNKVMNYQNTPKIKPKNNINNISICRKHSQLSKSPSSNIINDENKINDLNKTAISLNFKCNKKYRRSLKDKNLNFKTLQKTNSITNSEISNEEYEKEDEKFESIKFGFLRGYPLIQYNLSKVLLSSMSPQDVIIIFLYTFLEKDVIFFSKKIEYLSLTINAYQNLNFPLNDEKYYFINGCVSYDNFIKGNSSFVGSAFTTITGINDSYNSEYLNNNNVRLKEHLSVDLDSGEIHQEIDNNKNSNNDKKFLNFIKKVCKSSEYKENDTILFREIWKLHDNLKKFRDLNDNFSYIYYDKKIKIKNIKIQESFYGFINNICIYLYRNLKVHSNQNRNDTIKMEVYFDNNNSDYTYNNEEKFFLNELQDTMKFQSFIYGFIQSYNPIDLYKIPLTFTEEFISILSRKNIKTDQLKFLSLIDDFYYKMGKERFDIDFLPFLLQYYKKYKKDFDRLILENSKNSKIKNDDIVFYDEEKEEIFYRWMELDNKIIIHYLNLIKNLDKNEYNQIFYLAVFIKQNIIKEVFLRDIENEIELHFINENLISKSDICCGNIILLFTLALKNFKSSNGITPFLDTLFYDFIIFRKYYAILMNIAYKLTVECSNKKSYLQVDNFLNSYYACVNSISEKNLVPNEQLMDIIKKFNSIDIKKLGNAKKEEEQKKEKKDTFDEFSEPITKENLFMIYNFNSKGIINEPQLLSNVNKNNMDKKLEIDISLSKKNIKITPKLRFLNSKKTFESEIYSQKYILEMLTKEYDKFNEDLDNEKLDSKFLLEAIMNIFLFVRNSDEFKNKSEISKVLHTIFYIYFEKRVKYENNQK